MADPVIIEFIGTPGAGKTTLLPTVTAYFRRRGVGAYTVVEAARPYAERTWLGRAVRLLAPPALRRPLLWQVFYLFSTLHRFRFSARNRTLIETVDRFQGRRPLSRADHRHVTYWFRHLTGYYEFLRAYALPGEVLVLDEGFVHRVVQLFASEVEEPEPGRITAYLDLLPRPDMVIFPYAPKEICEKRVYDRGVWERFRHKSRADVSRYIANSEVIVDLAVAHMTSSGWPVIGVDNSGNDPLVSKTMLLWELSSLFARSSALAGSSSAT